MNNSRATSAGMRWSLLSLAMLAAGVVIAARADGFAPASMKGMPMDSAPVHQMPMP